MACVLLIDFTVSYGDTRDMTYNYFRTVLSADALVCCYLFVSLGDGFCTFAQSHAGSAVCDNVYLYNSMKTSKRRKRQANADPLLHCKGTVSDINIGCHCWTTYCTDVWRVCAFIVNASREVLCHSSIDLSHSVPLNLLSTFRPLDFFNPQPWSFQLCCSIKLTFTDDMLLGVLKTYPARKLLSNNAQLRKMSCLGPGYARMHIFLWFYHLLAPVAASDQCWKWKGRGIIPVNPSAWELHDANIMAEGLA